MLTHVGRIVRGISPRAILLAGLALFLIYSWPGFIGWDSRTHLLEARSGVYSDGHPPAVAWTWRIVELFVAGPAGMLLLQAVTLLVGLYLVFRVRARPQVAALAAALVFVYPPISGVTALIGKDALFAGYTMIAIGLLGRTRGHRWALLFVLLASLMRWNALAATFAPMVLLFRWRPDIRGVKRYAIALGLWVGITGVAFEANELLTTKREHYWYWSHAYQDIAGTLNYVAPRDDAQMAALLDGLPLRATDRLHARLRARYNPAGYFDLMRGPDRLLEIPRDDAERAAVAAAWKRVVFGYPDAYLRYRWDNFRLMIRLDRPPAFTAVYIWFHVLAAPETVDELEHDAAPSRLQGKLRVWSQRISLTPLYFTFIYFFACFVLLPVCRRRTLEASILLSAIGYELAWFFLAPTTDVRYSQWMITCCMVVIALLVIRRWPPATEEPAAAA